MNSKLKHNITYEKHSAEFPRLLLGYMHLPITYLTFFMYSAAVVKIVSKDSRKCQIGNST